jgi:Protein of unknown function (DUF3662)/FHA domain
MGLQSFERALENMVEVVFSRSSRSSIRPVELGRRLLREMDDHRSVDVKGRRIVPNAFTFHLSPRDHAGFAEIEHALNHELSEAAREYARDEGYHFIGPLSVDLVVDNTLKAGRFGISSQLREQAAPPRVAAEQSFSIVDHPSVVEQAPPAPPAPPAAPAFPLAPPPVALPIAEATPPPSSPAPAGFPRPGTQPATPQPQSRGSGRVQLPSGERVTVGASVVTIGRLPECTITLLDPNVSRRHAEIRPGAPIVIADLGSTNGTKVNGLRIDGERVLSDGDIISLGSTHLRFEASNPSA